MGPVNFSDVITQIYKLSDTVKDDVLRFKLRMTANAIAKLGNEYNEGRYGKENEENH
jgi:hypothetical protein